jgi:hypothetical protein
MDPEPTPFGKYELVSRLAAGGMAELFLARTRGLSGFEKYLVIKRILSQRTGDADFVRMFLDEARIAATLDHPNVVQIYDVGSVDGEYFIAMEYISGHNLVELLRAGQRRGEAGLPLAIAIAVVAGAAAGLHYAHEKRDFNGRALGIVHRDVTPQNVMVTFDGAVKVVDFGIVKAASRDVDTNAGTLKGKFGYMSPEQCCGQPLDRRSDIFALGVLLYELSTGRRLYKEKSEFETLRKIVDGPVPTLSAVDATLPLELDVIVQHCLQKSPDDRFPDARALLTALETLAREQRYNIGVTALAQFMEQRFAAEVHAHHDAGGVSSLATARGVDTSPSYFGEAKGGRTVASVPMSMARERFHRRRRLRLALLTTGMLALVCVGWWQFHAHRPSSSVGLLETAPPPVAPEPIFESSELTGPGDAEPQLIEGKLAALPSATLPLSPTIICRLLVGSDGRVQRAQVFRSRLELAIYEDAAITTAQGYRFHPAQHAGKPVAAWINWPVRFGAAQ